MSKHLFGETRSRQDVVDRQLRNKQTSVTVVKSTLNQFCKMPALRHPLDLLLKEVNKAIAEAYLLANLHVIRLCKEGITPEPLDQSFFYGCLSAVSQTGRQKTPIKQIQFRQSVELYTSWRNECEGYVAPDSQYLASGFYQNTSLQMVTNTRNSTSMQFGRRFKRFLRSKHSLDKEQAYLVQSRVMANEYDGEDELVLHYRSKLQGVNYGKLEDYPHLVMPLQYEFLRHFELGQASSEKPDKQVRLFNLMPTKQGFDCSHVKICSNGLHGLLKRSGMQVPGEGVAWRAVAGDFWRRLFHVEKFETCNRKFANEMLTDGKSVSIVMRKPKSLGESATSICKVSLDDYDDVLGLDPGRTDLYTTCDTEGNNKHYSTRNFYENAKYKKSNKTIKGWQTRDDFIEDSMKYMPTKKTADLETLKTYVLYTLPRMDQLMSWFMVKPFRKLKLTRYIFAKKTLRRICSDLTARAGSKTLIGFGDWSNKDNAGIIKKSPAGPVKRVEQELKKVCTVLPVDEFRTSKLHNTCGCTLHHRYCHKHKKKKEIYEESDGVGKTVKVHSVLFCDNRSCGMSMNRDENASRNILQLLLRQLEHGTRPAHFSRGCRLEECTGAPWSISTEVSVQPVHSGIII